MVELLTTFSPIMILLCCTMIFLAAKSIIDYKKWAVKTADEAYEKRHEVDKLQEMAIKTIGEYNEELKAIKESLKALENIVGSLASQVATLTESDRDDIKAWIVQQHHCYCYQKKGIDDFTMDVIEKRFRHYKNEGGNGYIEGLMEDLRKLPKGLED